MKNRILAKTLLVLILTAQSQVEAQAAGLATSAPQAVNRPTDQVVVKFASSSRSAKSLNDLDLAALKTAINSFGYSSRFLRTTATGGHVFKLDRFVPASALTAALTGLSQYVKNIESAEPDAIASNAQVFGADPNYPNQWYLYNTPGGINPVPAWNYTLGAGVTVAVLDTGYLPHQDLSTVLSSGYDFVSDITSSNDGGGRDANAMDPGDWRVAGQCPSPFDGAQNSSWHGLFVTGVIAETMNNGIGGVGVAPSATILPVRVTGACGAYSSDIADGVTWASGGTVPGVPANSNPARVLNISIGAHTSCPSYLQAAISGARNNGATIVVAAGNDAIDASNSSPANCLGVIVVAATDQTGGKASFSNYGSIVSLSAPGVQIESTSNTGTTSPGQDSYLTTSGTSSAAPMVTGVAALMLSVNPTLNPDDVTIVLKGTAKAFPVSCSGCGSGIVNAANAVNAVRPGAATGTFSTSWGTRSGTSSSLALTNSGSGWVTGIKASCSQSGSSITSPPPSALGPGQTVLIQAAVNSFTYTCGYVVSGNNATNSSYVDNNF